MAILLNLVKSVTASVGRRQHETCAQNSSPALAYCFELSFILATTLRRYPDRRFIVSMLPARRRSDTFVVGLKPGSYF